MTTILDNIDRRDDVGMLERRSNAKLCCNLFLVLLFRLACSLGAKLFDSVNGASSLGVAFDKPHCATGAATQYTTPFSILL